MKSPLRPQRAARAAVFAVLAGTTLSLLSSCASIFGFDDYKDSAGDLCDLVEKCYDFSSCDSHVGAHLSSASAAERSKWLAAVPNKSCLASCSKSRKCLNIAPVCNAIGQSCKRKEECCNFLAGTAGCQVPATSASGADGGDADAGDSGMKQCCLANGAVTDNSALCCSGPENYKNGACGGFVCRPSGVTCEDGSVCCTGICSDGQCADDICVPIGTPCKDGEVCCGGSTCIAGQCGFPADCRPLLTACNTKAVAQTEGACCDKDETTGKALVCKLATPVSAQVEGEDGLCQVEGEECSPKGYSCSNVAPCCEPNVCREGECRPACVSVGTDCTKDGDCCSENCDLTTGVGKCACSDVYCALDTDCCGGGRVCAGGVCTAPCGTLGCHDECIPGPPLSRTAPCTGVDLKCVNTVCDIDAYCCCNDWDYTCTKLAVTKCGAPASACN